MTVTDLEALGLDGVENAATGAVVLVSGELEVGCLDTAGNTTQSRDVAGIT